MDGIDGMGGLGGSLSGCVVDDVLRVIPGFFVFHVRLLVDVFVVVVYVPKSVILFC